MAPKLVSIANETGTLQYLYMIINGSRRSFMILNRSTLAVGGYISDTDDATIQVNEDDPRKYYLKYDNKNNIMINDTLGREKSAGDTAVRTYESSEDIQIIIRPDGIRIWCTARDLGVYQPDGKPKYYKSVLASHKEGVDGGITITGIVPDAQNKEDEFEGENSKD